MNKLILGIETSCDETSAAVVKNGREILSNVISSQIATHQKFGGVVPEIASREHINNISQVVDKALELAKISLSDIDGIAVTHGPGLVGALLVGVAYAKALAYATSIPLVGVHHIKSHICAGYLENNDIKPPFVSLVVSGGHTSLIYVKDYINYELLGSTKDDAVGEAFDKVARVLGLPYPGGPEIDKLALLGKNNINFPRAMLKEANLDFSFSGLKSSVLNYINQCKMQKTEIVAADIATSFQHAAIDILVTKTMKACKQKNVNLLTVAGGVACNSFLRQEIQKACENGGIAYHIPKPEFCTDNAAMVASNGYFHYLEGKFSGLDLNAVPNFPL